MPRARATVLALGILACVAGDCAVETYYADVDLTLTGSALRDALHARVRSPHNVIPYTSDTVDAGGRAGLARGAGTPPCVSATPRRDADRAPRRCGTL